MTTAYKLCICGKPHDGSYGSGIFCSTYCSHSRSKLIVPFDCLSIVKKKKLVLSEQNNSCALCGIKNWRNQELQLHLDHIDGNSRNDLRSNLRCICPNCHSQTETYCGKNASGSRLPIISDEVLLDAIQTTSSIKQALRKVGYSANIHNYHRCRRLLGISVVPIKYEYDWTAIQKDHNEGLTWKNLQKKYGVSLMTLNKAKHAGRFISRGRNHEFYVQEKVP